MSDAAARREFDVARRIHGSMRATESDRPEILSELSEETASRGRRLARQVLLATTVLVAMNVLLGLAYIAHHESKRPNRALLEKQSREQLRQALDKTAAAALTPPSLGVAELRVTVENGRAQSLANEIAQIATRLNGTTTKGLPDKGQIEVLVDLAPDRAEQFRSALANIAGVRSVAPADLSVGAGGQKISIVVQIAEAE